MIRVRDLRHAYASQVEEFIAGLPTDDQAICRRL